MYVFLKIVAFSIYIIKNILCCKMNDDETGDWCPPNEAEMKVLEARRERNNQISRLMANYMLKGI